MFKYVIIGLILVGMFCSPMPAAPPASPREVTDWDIDRAVNEIFKYLDARQDSEGHWSKYGYHRGSVSPGAPTAWVVFAMLEAGRDYQHPVVQKGLDALMAMKTDKTDVRSIRAMVFGNIVEKTKNVTGEKIESYRKQLKEDIDWLTKNWKPANGAWGYDGPLRYGDNLCTQFAVAALEAANRGRVEIPKGLVLAAERTMVQRQQKDGGWIIDANGRGDSTAYMTAAVLANMYICQDMVPRVKYHYQVQRDRAWDFLNANLTKDFVKNGYLAYCVQRIGQASGRKFIGGIDWFDVGASKFAAPRPGGHGYGGAWGPDIAAALEMIFLARGQIPLTFNKLEHGTAENWNAHARDLARLTEELRRYFDGLRLRWQTVKLTEDVQMMLDAPILMISGTKPLDFTPEQWAKLKEYTLAGGTVLFVPTGRNNKEFIESAKKAVAGLYEDWAKKAGNYYTLEQLPNTHPIYSAEVPLSKRRDLPTLWGLSDGTRLLMVISESDLAEGWQRGAPLLAKTDYQMGINFFRYATGKNKLKRRMRPEFKGTSTEQRYTTNVAWMKHDGNWCTQPYALEDISKKCIAENRVGLKVTAGCPFNYDALKNQQLAWMTGTGEFTLTDKEITDMRRFLEGGGTLFVNAIGGSAKFHKSALNMLDRIFRDANVNVAEVSSNAPLMTGVCGEFRGPRIDKLERTQAWRNEQPQAGRPYTVYVVDGRIVAILAPFGIHDTIDGHTAYGAKSYMPIGALDLAANVALYGSMKHKPVRLTRPPASQPTTGPTTAPTTQPGGLDTGGGIELPGASSDDGNTGGVNTGTDITLP